MATRSCCTHRRPRRIRTHRALLLLALLLILLRSPGRPWNAGRACRAVARHDYRAWRRRSADPRQGSGEGGSVAVSADPHHNGGLPVVLTGLRGELAASAAAFSLDAVARELDARGERMRVYASRSALLVKHHNTKVTRLPLSRLLRDCSSSTVADAMNSLICRKKLAPRCFAHAAPRTLGRPFSRAVLERADGLVPPAAGPPRGPPAVFRAWVEPGVQWAAHYDAHYNTVLQLHGTKTWTFVLNSTSSSASSFASSSAGHFAPFPPGHPAARHSPVDLSGAAGDDILRTNLSAGEVLLVPPMLVHFTEGLTETGAAINWFTDVPRLNEEEEEEEEEL